MFNYQEQSDYLSEEKIEELKAEFLNLDLDCDGTISITELAKVLISMRIRLKASDTEIKRALRQFDRDGDGEINLVEYYQTMRSCPHHNLVHRALIMRSSARAEFLKIDVDGSGYISMDEIKQVLESRTKTHWTNEQLEAVVKYADRNRDGQINYEEFLYGVYGKLDDILSVSKAEERKRFSFKRRNRNIDDKDESRAKDDDDDD